MKAVEDFDTEITRIEEKANKLSAYKWAIYSKNENTDTCFAERSLSVNCEEIERCDYMLNACTFCNVQKMLDECYGRIKTTNFHQDPRLNPKAIDWNFLGGKIDEIFEKATQTAVKLDWRKFAMVIRGYMLYLLSIILTERMLKRLHEDRFLDTDLINLYSSGRFDKERLQNIFDKIDHLLEDLTMNGHSDDSDRFDQMTKMLGESPLGNELECTRYWGKGENDEYHCFEYENRTKSMGTVYGYLFTGCKRIVFDPLASEFVSQLIYDTPEREYQRIASLGVIVGNPHRFPTRRIRTKNRKNLWEEFSKWPDCTDTESNRICRLDQKFRCTVPEPLTAKLYEFDGSATNYSTMNARISQVEMIW